MHKRWSHAPWWCGGKTSAGFSCSTGSHLRFLGKTSPPIASWGSPWDCSHSWDTWSCVGGQHSHYWLWWACPSQGDGTRHCEDINVHSSTGGVGPLDPHWIPGKDIDPMLWKTLPILASPFYRIQRSVPSIIIRQSLLTLLTRWLSKLICGFARAVKKQC